MEERAARAARERVNGLLRVSDAARGRREHFEIVVGHFASAAWAYGSCYRINLVGKW
jgi:hypothetical protein